MSLDKLTTDTTPNPAGPRRVPAWLLPVGLLLGFAAVFLALFGSRLVPALPVEAVPVVTLRTAQAQAPAPRSMPHNPGAQADRQLLFQASGWVEPDPFTIYVPTLVDGIVKDVEEAKKIAEELGYPVMIKATAGGGGKGMRPAFNEAALESSFVNATTEAEKAFGNGACYIEKLILNPHHIEFQVVGDSHGNVAHLGERDCSLQRRNQKIIEETPSCLLQKNKKLRKKMGDASVRLAKEIGYENCGTIEYLVDDEDNFYFMEMNTRIQVEHPITEEIYGCDLIKEQIRIAAGEPISDHVLKATPRGHAIECRINAEDPYNDFRPSPGKIELFYASGGRGVRVDTHIYSGYSVPPYYDSMIAKLIVTGATREICIDRTLRALNEFLVEGIKTTIPFQDAILKNSDFRSGDYNIAWVENFLSKQPSS